MKDAEGKGKKGSANRAYWRKCPKKTTSAEGALIIHLVIGGTTSSMGTLGEDGL